MSVFQMKFTATDSEGNSHSTLANFPQDYCDEILQKVFHVNLESQMLELYRDHYKMAGSIKIDSVGYWLDAAPEGQEVTHGVTE